MTGMAARGPAMPATGRLSPAPYRMGAMHAPELSGHRPLRVLVIEDNSDAAETLGDLLRLFGHEAEVALSGPAGLEAARRLRPHVILCDIGLPGMDGYAVASCLRSEPATRAAHLVALTGYGRDSDRQRTQEAGFDLHLVKPLEPLELKRLLEEWAKAPEA